MPASSENKKLTAIILFILRNTVLFVLVINGYMHFSAILNPVFLSIIFFIAIGVALVMHLTRLRLPVACIILILIIIFSRLIIFQFYNLSAAGDSISDADFLFFHFDREFFPALIPGVIAWLFNILALRYKHFIFMEIGINALLMLLVFITEVNHSLKMFHPTVLSLILAAVILMETGVLLTSWMRDNRQGTQQNRWYIYFLLIIPVLLMLFIFDIIKNQYNKESIKTRGGLMESTLFRFDFSKYVNLESEIKLSDDLVMLFRKNGPAKRLLIRRFVLSDYDPDKGFFQSKKEFDFIPVIVPDLPLLLEDPGYSGREPVDQEFFFVNLDPTSLVAMNYPVSIVPFKNWDKSSFQRIYKVSSMVTQELPDTLLFADTPSMPVEEFLFYTKYAADEYIREKAMEITEDIEFYTDKVMAIRDYLQQNYYYSLKPGIASDGNQLKHFLEVSRKGYCSYYAFSMALLCRSIGIPARVVVGFVAIPGFEVLNIYEIRANQAHAWVEVFFEDEGWIEYDPTSSIPAEGEDLSFMTDFNMSDELQNLINEIMDNQADLIEEEVPAMAALSKPTSLEDLLKNFNSFITKTWYFLMPLLYVLILTIIKKRFFIRYLVTHGHRDKIKHLYIHSLVYLYNIGRIKGADESLVEYGARMEKIHGIRLGDWTAGYLKAIFGEVFNAADYNEAVKRYKKFIMSYKKGCHPFIRITAHLNPIHSLKKKGA